MRRVALASVCALAVGIGGGYTAAQLTHDTRSHGRTYEQGVKDGQRRLLIRQQAERDADARARALGGGDLGGPIDDGW